MNSKKTTIATVVLIMVAIIILTILATQDQRRWNNGVCPNCGTAWELIKEVPALHANESAEVWQCPHCHKTITIGTP